MDTDAFIRDGYAVVRGAFGRDTARACREMIWDVLAARGISPDYPGEVGSRNTTAFRPVMKHRPLAVCHEGMSEAASTVLVSGTAGRAGAGSQGPKACGAGVRPRFALGGLR